MKLRYSALSTFQGCPRKFQKLYREEREEEVHADYMAIGTFWHELLETRLRTKSDDVSSVWATYSGGEDTGIQMRAVYDEYCTRYRDDSSWEILSLEDEISYQKWGHDFTSTFDGLVRNADGLVYLLEHKLTTTNDLYRWKDMRPFDMQTDLYCTVAKEVLGYDVAGVIMDITRRPKFKYNKLTYSTREAFYNYVNDKIDDGFFLRYIIPFNQERVDRILADGAGIVAQIEQCESSGNYPRNRNNCCSFGGTCGFLGECEPEGD